MEGMVRDRTYSFGAVAESADYMFFKVNSLFLPIQSKIFIIILYTYLWKIIFLNNNNTEHYG